jgi:hypothetical protein
LSVVLSPLYIFALWILEAKISVSSGLGDQ